MRDFVSYFSAGALAALAIVVIAQPGDANTASERASMTSMSKAPLQTVDRSNKGDRLAPATAVRPQPLERPRMMAGCDPAFSPLSTSAAVNFAARCVA
ncbi:MAG: hypothetical protein Q8M26_10345 [Pseudolabrys sp.]|nr:hypothetical protein [Pseudolabrys sp.]